MRNEQRSADHVFRGAVYIKATLAPMPFSLFDPLPLVRRELTLTEEDVQAGVTLYTISERISTCAGMGKTS